MISVVVPVFQGEKYIASAIENILNQTYQDFELIIVDDGSTDETGYICDEYARADVRVKVFHQVNKGSSEARQFGVKSATGKYICFVDCDDSVDETYLETLYQYSCTNPDSDIIVTGYKLSYPDGGIQEVFEKGQYNTYSCEDAIYTMLECKLYSWEMVGKLYKSEIIKNYDFPKGFSYAEDFVANWELFHMTTMVTYYPYAGYYYLHHGGNMTSNRKKKRIDYVEAFNCVFIGKYRDGITWKYVLKRMESMLYYALNEWIMSEDDFDDYYTKLISIMKKVIFEEERISVKPDREYEWFSTSGDNIRKRIERDCAKLIDEIKDYSSDYKKLFVFGNGIWAKRLVTIMEYFGVSFDGFVVTKESELTKAEDYSLSYPISVVSELGIDDGVILCISAKYHDEVVEELNAEKKSFIDVSIYRTLICQWLQKNQERISIQSV